MLIYWENNVHMQNGHVLKYDSVWRLQVGQEEHLIPSLANIV